MSCTVKETLLLLWDGWTLSEANSFTTVLCLAALLPQEESSGRVEGGGGYSVGPNLQTAPRDDTEFEKQEGILNPICFCSQLHAHPAQCGRGWWQKYSLWRIPSSSKFQVLRSLTWRFFLGRYKLVTCRANSAQMCRNSSSIDSSNIKSFDQKWKYSPYRTWERDANRANQYFTLVKLSV